MGMQKIWGVVKEQGFGVHLLIGIAIGCAISGVIIYFHESTATSNFFSFHESHQGKNELTNPLLECDFGSLLSQQNLQSFKDKIANYVNYVKRNNDASEVSVYFRDLNNGPTFGINPELEFYPASLLKVPVLIATLEEAEANPGLLDQEIKFERKEDTSRIMILPKVSLTLGRSYSIEELLEHMIRYSDNEAAPLIAQVIGLESIKSDYNDLGIDLPPNSPESFMSVRAYAAFFRILYNSSYLGRDSSEKALRLLSQVDYKEGLVAGVPPDITVAHKFGETVSQDLNDNQLHDCGIIYHPKRPYLLCVMTRGNDFSKLPTIIKSISAIAYREVDKQSN
jgi:beta-lactamase class A